MRRLVIETSHLQGISETYFPPIFLKNLGTFWKPRNEKTRNFFKLPGINWDESTDRASARVQRTTLLVLYFSKNLAVSEILVILITSTQKHAKILEQNRFGSNLKWKFPLRGTKGGVREGSILPRRQTRGEKSQNPNPNFRFNPSFSFSMFGKRMTCNQKAHEDGYLRWELGGVLNWKKLSWMSWQRHWKPRWAKM